MHPFHPHHQMYTGAPMFPAAPFPGPMMGHHHPEHHHGFCHSCCHPHSHCMCHRRECRKEAKELVVSGDTAAAVTPMEPNKVDDAKLNLLRAEVEGLRLNKPDGAVEGAAGALDRKAGHGTAFIGGGCCVHLSVEYMAENPAAALGVRIAVADSEGTTLMWMREEPAGTPYRIKEGIITTKPGAKLLVIVKNATARVRWCEIFSC